MLKTLVIPVCIVAAVLFARRPSGQAAPPADSKPAENAPAYDPPRILVAASIDEDDDLLLVNVRTIYIGFDGESYNDRSLSKTSLKDVGIFTVQGESVSVDEARGQLAGKDTPILCSSNNTPLPAFYASMFVPDTLHFVFPDESPTWGKIQGPGTPFR